MKIPSSGSWTAPLLAATLAFAWFVAMFVAVHPHP